MIIDYKYNFHKFHFRNSTYSIDKVYTMYLILLDCKGNKI